MEKLFSEKYISVREKEKRIYTDSEVKMLPDISQDHIHYKEWLIRKRSANNLIRYLLSKKKSLSILEIGCGNGWLSAQLAKVDSFSVTGIDVNQLEIEQAQRVFKDIPNLKFILTDIRSGKLNNEKFDIIIFAASIQYFQSLAEILITAIDHLTKNGEIHIVDTVFYKFSDIGLARERTKNYYTSLGFPDMAKYYFHHSIDELSRFKPTIMYNPNSFINKLLKRQHFHWISIAP